jgi:hypothetical protein
VHWHVREPDTVFIQCYYGREDGLLGTGDAGMGPMGPGSPPLVPGFNYEWRFGEPTWNEDGRSQQIDRFVKALWTISAQISCNAFRGHRLSGVEGGPGGGQPLRHPSSGTAGDPQEHDGNECAQPDP